MKMQKIHSVIYCTQCDKHWDDYLTAEEKARKHSKSTGHTVEGEVAYRVRYENGIKK